jgi:hypothetical protein
LDRGRAQFKEPDPATGPLVRAAFELYATGEFNFHGLLKEVTRRGLRNRRGSLLTPNGLSVMLNNPFYIGLIRLRRTGELFEGGHQPLVSKPLFDRVQREMVQTLTSDRSASGKNLEITLRSPFREIAERSKSLQCDPYRDVPRTQRVWDHLFETILAWVKATPGDDRACPSNLTADTLGA